MNHFHSHLSHTVNGGLSLARNEQMLNYSRVQHCNERERKSGIYICRHRDALMQGVILIV